MNGISQIVTLRTGLLSVLLGIGCSGQRATDSNILVGSFSRASVNGSSLPAIIDRSEVKTGTGTTLTTVEALSGVLTLRKDGTFVNATRIRVTQDVKADTATTSLTGRYTINADVITLTYSSGDVFSGTLTPGASGITGLSSLGRSYSYELIRPD